MINFAEANQEMIDDLAEYAQRAGSPEELERVLDDLRFNAEAIDRHGRRALDIMMAMLALSRGQDAAPQPIDLNTLVDQYSSLAYHGLRGRGIEVPAPITLELADGLPKVAAVEADLGRVILNLVSNACEAISGAGHQNPDAQLAITLSTEQTSDNQVEIRIRDTGTGIPREDVERIFEPSFTTKAAGEGTGLGLAISRDIVLKHEGQISVHSDPGRFTEFVVALPIARAPVGASV